MKLHFVNTVLGEYGTRKLRFMSELAMVRKFKHHIRNKVTKSKTIWYGLAQSDQDSLDPFDYLEGGISSKTGMFSHVLMMDVDWEDFKDCVSAKLDQLKVPHIVVQSSSNKRYWVIADKFFLTKYGINRFIDLFPEVDPRYVDFGKRMGWNLRGFPKKGFVPVVVERHGEGSKKFQKFVELFEEYWSKPHISWLVHEYIIENI